MLCIRCKQTFGSEYRCRECGVARDRKVQKKRRRRPIGGKRGRNSGTTNTNKNKKGK